MIGLFWSAEQRALQAAKVWRHERYRMPPRPSASERTLDLDGVRIVEAGRLVPDELRVAEVRA